MNVGWYYHLEFVVDEDGTARLPAHLGLLLRGIADEAGQLTFYGHSRKGAGNEDFALPRDKITVVDLGPLRGHPARTFRPGPDLRRFHPQRDGVDVMVVQGPTALLPHLVRASDVPVALLIGGDLRSWQWTPSLPWWRNVLIKLWARVYGRQQNRAAAGVLALLNNPHLAETVRGSHFELVSITSVEAKALPPENDGVAWAPGKGTEEPVRLLYSGRIKRAKGVFEAVESLRVLDDRGYQATLDFVGWEEPTGTIDALMEHARANAVEDRIRFLGYRPAGPELLSTYANADVFVIPTHWDSFPRSLHEAMAVGLPSIATPVGGIGHFLHDRDEALLIRPKDAAAVADAVQSLVDDEVLRRGIAERGRAWARRHTIETSAREIVDHLRSLVRSMHESTR